ncbi:LOW QUALITY PROTEIN: activating signal cointegrator 1 complex subunit 2 [Procambarus clarkii]
MSSTGAIPKGGARPKLIKPRDSDVYEKQDESEMLGDPLEKKFITLNGLGLEKRVPALHIAWTQKSTYIKYVPPPLPEEGFLPAGARESWLEQMEFLEQDLRNLLSLPHHKFWSQMVYDPAVHECLESYITNSYRWYDGDILEDYSRPLVETLHHLVFLIYVRMATYKESKTCHITPSIFGDIIYEHFMFDICKLLDLCMLFGPANGQLLAKMINNIFTRQPKYYEDLSQAVSSICMALEKVEDKLGVAEYYVPVALGAPIENLSISDLHDMIIYLIDTFSSIQMLITIHPPAAKYFHDVGFELRMASCYERVIPALIDNVNECCNDPEWSPKIAEKIQLTRSSILMAFRAILHHKCLAPLSVECPPPVLVGECVEKFMQVMSTCVGDKTFITDYCSTYPITKDLEFFQQHGGDITSLSFIKEAVDMVLKEMGLASGMTNLTLNEVQHTEVKETEGDTSGMNGYAQVGSAVPNHIELASLVSNVQDLLPELGAGFIQECLKYYCYSTEDVIHALLEGSLPPSLVTLDRSMPAQVEQKPSSPPLPPSTEDDTQTKGVQQTDFMDRANVWNNDEFDVFSRSDIDKSKVYKGKKPKHIETLGTDKESIDKIKEIARKYDERGGTSIYEDEFRYEPDEHSGWTYDDEYDDTYDDNEAGNIDDLGVEKAVKRRPGIIGAGRLNTQIDYAYADESPEESDKEETSKGVEDKEDSSQKGPKEQVSVRPKSKGGTRGVQRIFSNSSRSKQHTPTPERESSEEAGKDSNTPFQTGFRSFCEDPAIIRQRAEQRRQERDALRNRGNRGRGEPFRREDNLTNGTDGERPGTRQKFSQASNRNSGKGWRQGQGGGGGDDDNRGYRGGKYQEDTNHGKAQSQQYRHKMMHKNEHKRHGAQTKFNKNS